MLILKSDSSNAIGTCGISVSNFRWLHFYKLLDMEFPHCLRSVSESVVKKQVERKIMPIARWHNIILLRGKWSNLIYIHFVLYLRCVWHLSWGVLSLPPSSSSLFSFGCLEKFSVVCNVYNGHATLFFCICLGTGHHGRVLNIEVSYWWE